MPVGLASLLFANIIIMPGPGARGKGKAKKSKAASMSPSTSSVSQQEEEVSRVYVPEIEHAETWDAVVSMLCNYFNLPGLCCFHVLKYHLLDQLKTLFIQDLSTRSGLKKVHANFSSIYSKLEKAYEQSARDNYKIKGGVVGIVAKMCVDSLLRNKLFGKGIPLLLYSLSSLFNTQALFFF